MRNHLLAVVIAGTALALSACDGDGTGPGDGGGTLTAAEAAALNRAILGLSSGVRGEQTANRSTSPTGESTGSLNFTFDQTLPCQPGGKVDVAGSMGMAWDDVTETGGVSADFAVAHDECEHALDSGEIITITGDPDIDVTLDATTGPGGLASLVITERGAFTWVREGGTGGRCTLDVTAQLDPATEEVLVSGRFCGVDVSGSYAGG